MWPERRRFEDMVTLDPEALLPLARVLALKLFGAVVAILAVIAAADYLFQYRQWFERQKMSLREVKEEFKQSDGDPKIKAKIRQLRASRAKKRMMAAVPKATVVITNPTHFAVALQYERGMNAPRLRRQGHRLARPEDPRSRRRARRRGRGEPAARPHASCRRRDRPGDSGRALQGGRRGDRLRDAAQRQGTAMTFRQAPRSSVAPRYLRRLPQP